MVTDAKNVSQLKITCLKKDLSSCKDTSQSLKEIFSLFQTNLVNCTACLPVYSHFFLIVILTCFSGKYTDFDGQYLASRGLATTDDSKSNFCNHRKISNDGAATSVQSDIFPNSFFKPKRT